MPASAAGKKRAKRNTQTSHRTDSREDYGRHVGRTFRILKRLAKSPATSEELAEECGTSVRTITRFMSALGRETPTVYARRSPGPGVQRWALDVEKFIAEFTATTSPTPAQKRNGG